MATVQHIRSVLERTTSERPWLIATTSGAAALVAFAAWCTKDYHDYLALGPGGSPYNSGATHVAEYPTQGSHTSIQNLPRRQGDRAVLGGIAPHRQLSQHTPGRMRAMYINNLFNNSVRQHLSILEIKKSLYERHHDALFVAHKLFVAQKLFESRPDTLPNTAIIARGELGHAHPDISVHLYLSPANARVIIEKGWAERHRLSVPERSFVKNKYAIASKYLMIRGPRNEKEMEILRVILENIIRFMTGQKDVEEVEWKEAI